MSLTRTTGQKAGNNTLFIILGILFIILLVLIFLSKTSESSVNDLIQSAAPDSSAFASQELSAPIPEEEPAPQEAEKKKVEIVSLPDTAAEQAVPLVSKDSLPATPVAEKPKIEEGTDGKVYFYKIRKGDTMYKIAARFGNKPADILALNSLADMSLQADKEIKVKIKALHQAVGGEGLNAIAEKYGVPSKSILIANGLSSESLASGVQLIIPLK